jgi:hypothetical protein
LFFYINGDQVWDGTGFTDLTTGRLGIEFERDGISTGNKLLVDWARATIPSVSLDPFTETFPEIAAR